MATVNLALPRISVLKLCLAGFLLSAAVFAGARVAVLMTSNIPDIPPQEHIIKFDPDLLWPDQRRYEEGRRNMTITT